MQTSELSTIAVPPGVLQVCFSFQPDVRLFRMQTFYSLITLIIVLTECRGIIRRRDKEIRDLTQVTNKLEEKLNDVS